MESVLIISSVLLWIIILFNLLLTLALIRQRHSTLPTDDNQGPAVGQSAPPFTAKTLLGKSVTLEDYRGRKTVLIAFGPDCGDCIDALPGYEALSPVAERSGVQLVLVSDRDAEITCAFVERYNVRLPILVAPAGKNPFREDYNFRSVPGFCSIDEHGRVESSGYPNLIWGKEWKKLTQSWQTQVNRSPMVARA